MKTLRIDVRVKWVAAVAVLVLVAGCTASTPAVMAPSATPTALNPTPIPGAVTLTTAGVLSSAEEVPPNPSKAHGKSSIQIGADKSVTGTIYIRDMTPTMAHIHEAAKGQNGPVIVPFIKTGDITFGPAPGAKLTDEQYASYLAGNLYINVHSAAYPGGEIRMQIVPTK